MRRITAAGEGTCISDGRDKSRRVQRPNARNGDQPPRMLVLASVLDKLLVKNVNPIIEHLPAFSHVTDECANAVAKRQRRVGEQVGQPRRQLGFALRYDMPAFKEHAPDLVHQRPAFPDRPIPGAVQGLHVQLGLALQLYEPHGRPGRGLGDRFGVSVIVLLYIWPHIRRRHKAHDVTLRGELSAHVMRPATRLHRDDARWQLRGIGDNGLAPHATSNHDLAGAIQPDEAEAVLAKIDAEYRNLHWYSPSLI